MWYQDGFEIHTQGRGTYDITGEVRRVVGESAVRTGLCHVFIHHTSASVMMCENADPSVRSDLEAFMEHLVPDGNDLFRHVAEGPDDMPSHVRSVLTDTSVSMPVTGGELALGTWQGVYLWEHRYKAHRRRFTVTVQGDST